MFERFTRKSMAATGAVLLAALGVSGVAIAQTSNSTSPPAKVQSAPAPGQSNEKPGMESTAPENSKTDPDNVQYTAPGDPNANTAAAMASASTSVGSKSSAEKPGTEQSAASEQSGSEQPGSEVSNDDGPGGHADEPGNPNADHQFQGNE